MGESRRKQCIKDNKLGSTYSSLFILPMFEYESDFLPKCFIEAYLIDTLVPKLVLCLVNEDSEKMKHFIEFIQTDDNYHSIDYDDNNNEIVIQLKIPKQYHKDFYNLKIGRFSKFDEKFKQILLDYHGRKSGNGKHLTMIDVLYPNHQSKNFRAETIGCSINDLPNGEVMDIINFDKELYLKTDEFVNKYKKINK